MSEIVDIGKDSIDYIFDHIMDQVDRCHYADCISTSITPIELTADEISQMSIDNALGEYLASLEK